MGSRQKAASFLHQAGRFGRFEMSAALPSPDLFNSNIVRGFGTAEPLRGSYSRINLRRKWAGVFLQTADL